MQATRGWDLPPRPETPLLPSTTREPSASGGRLRALYLAEAIISAVVSLVEALTRARSGYRSDVAALVEELGHADVLAPLARAADLPSSPTTLRAHASLALHTLPSGDGTVWAALFSGPETLGEAGTRNGWTTDGGPLRFVGLGWEAALRGVYLPVLESGENAGIVFDAGAPSELALNASEVISIARGEFVPLVWYASRQPTRGDEQAFVGDPAEAPPPALVDAIASALGAEPAVTSYHLRQVFVPERDVLPHLTLDIHTDASEPDRRRISRRVGESIRDITLPPPGYLDVAFNFRR